MHPPYTTQNPSRQPPWRRALALIGLALLVGSTLLPGNPRAGVPVLDNPLTPLGPDAPPQAPVDAQDCLEHFLYNSTRCKGLWCQPASFLWFHWTDCDDGNLQNCIDKVNQAYACCMDPSDCQPDPERPQP